MKNIKKAFTLIEVLISITLFSIIVIFLYQSLEITQKSNNFYSDKLELKQDDNSLKKMFFLDFIHNDSNVTASFDSENNSILTFESSNTYHNPFYNYITYFVSKESNLIRIESKEKFENNKLSDMFFDTCYIDIVAKDIIKFKLDKKKKSIYIKQKEKEDILFSIN